MRGTTNLLPSVLVTVVLLVVSGALFATGAQEAATAPGLEAIGFRATGYPIVDEPVTIEAVIVRPGHRTSPFSENIVMNEIQERTNVFIDWEELPEAQATERVNLMFASREFPHVFFAAGGGHNDSNIYTAARGGDIYRLNDYLDRYAPNWANLLDEYPIVKNAITFADGGIYSLPFVRDVVIDDVRDLQLINTDWLATVGMPKPTTLDEFREVLRAFRREIDDGTLPSSGVPWYFRFRQAVGGEVELYGSFGMYVYDDTFLSVADGTVEFAAVDPRMMDALEYLHGMYAERLFPEEVFTDPWDSYIAKRNSVPPIIGAVGSFHNVPAMQPYFDAIPPLPAEGADKPLFRSQPMRIQKNQFTVMTRFPYPEVAVRFINESAIPETALEMQWGRVGHELEERNGRLVQLGGISPSDLDQVRPNNFIASFLPRGISDRIEWDGVFALRAEYIRTYYQPYLWPQERHFPLVTYTDEEREELSILETEIYDYIEATHAGWIVNGGVRQGWDGYIRQLERLGYERMLEIYQTALDRMGG